MTEKETERATDIPSLLAKLPAEGDRPALSFYRGKALAGRLSYAELAARVAAVAELLSAKYGVTRGDRVGVLTPNRLEAPVLVLALLSLGAAVVPLNPASAPEDWAYILGHSKARGVCGTGELVERVVGRLAFALKLEELSVSGAGAAAGDAAGAGGGDLSEALGAVLYTSGTTGNPKGVALRQRSLLANAHSMADNFGLHRTTQFAVLPLYHAHAFGFGLMTALSTGGHLVFAEKLDPFTWAAVINAENVTVSSVVPTMLPMLLATGVKKDKVPTLRHLMVSSAPLPALLAREFETKTGLPLIQGWGQSEYTNFACCMSPALSTMAHDHLMYSEEVPSVGPALPGTEVRVQDAKEGERGELLIRGPSAMIGYLDDPETTARTLDAEGWLHTGDEGYFRLYEGRPHFFITGRLKEIIIRDAEKYSPQKLERALLDAVPELAGLLVVLGFPHADHGEEVGAYVQTDGLSEDLRARLRAACDALPVAERPKVILCSAEPIPRTHTGKIQRRKLQPLYERFRAHRGAMVLEG